MSRAPTPLLAESARSGASTAASQIDTLRTRRRRCDTRCGRITPLPFACCIAPRGGTDGATHYYWAGRWGDGIIGLADVVMIRPATDRRTSSRRTFSSKLRVLHAVLGTSDPIAVHSTATRFHPSHTHTHTSTTDLRRSTRCTPGNPRWPHPSSPTQQEDKSTMWRSPLACTGWIVEPSHPHFIGGVTGG